ncbi:MAG: hypothetical protein ACM3ZT_11475 [Bacillota bacterium]
MTPDTLILTSLLLGVFVLAGGGYGGLYGAGRLLSRRPLLYAGYGCYLLQALVTLGICIYSPLAPMWKTFIVLSWLAYAGIPPVTWRYLERLHRAEEGAR